MNSQKHIEDPIKGWLFSLLIILLFVVTGCNNQTPLQKKEVPSPSPVATQTPEPVSETLGQATTKIYDNIPQRNQNLELAIKAIDGTILNPDEEFSFNRTVGPRTEDKGYCEAIGYDEHGEKKPTVGGGICQISSTLYMAAKNGNFPVTERHSHSHPVPYADSEHDATVSYEGYDFKFLNNRDKPVIIRVSTDGAEVYAELIVTNDIKSP